MKLFTVLCLAFVAYSSATPSNPISRILRRTSLVPVITLNHEIDLANLGSHVSPLGRLFSHSQPAESIVSSSAPAVSRSYVPYSPVLRRTYASSSPVIRRTYASPSSVVSSSYLPSSSVLSSRIINSPYARDEIIKPTLADPCAPASTASPIADPCATSEPVPAPCPPITEAPIADPCAATPSAEPCPSPSPSDIPRIGSPESSQLAGSNQPRERIVTVNHIVPVHVNRYIPVVAQQSAPLRSPNYVPIYGNGPATQYAQNNIVPNNQFLPYSQESESLIEPRVSNVEPFIPNSEPLPLDPHPFEVANNLGVRNFPVTSQTLPLSQ